MRVLVVGGGAREHALAWTLAQSPRVSQVLVAPGNAGTREIAENLAIAANDTEGLARAAEARRVDLTVVGPEEPLALGLVDLFRERGLPVFGPTAAGARIESSKAWTKELLLGAGVPTAAARIFTDLAAALDWLYDAALPIVVKASGLAAGKGVVVASTRSQAEAALRGMLGGSAFGEAGREVLIEEYMQGPEVSVLALCDGRRALPLLPATDFKRAYDGDHGPNTGGMGAYAPVPRVDVDLSARIRAEILDPTLAALRDRGIDYRGVLYAGLMLTADGPKVVEYNCRFGDPECQVVLPLLDGDLLPLLLACAEGDLSRSAPPSWRSDAAVGVVLASAGYPGRYATGLPITGLSELPAEVMAFHAGTAVRDGEVVTSGGRVLTLVARAASFANARALAYQAAGRVEFQGKQFRSDIAATVASSTAGPRHDRR